MSHSNVTTLVTLLQDHADRIGDKPAFEYIGSPYGALGSLTFKELQQHTQALANVLGPDRHSQRAVLLFPPCLEFIVAFMACLRAGVVAVPLSLPVNRQDQAKMMSVIADCQPSMVLTIDMIANMPDSKMLADGMPQLSWLSVDKALSDATQATPHQATPAPSDVAFLQYTSGSTGHPKGVIVTHENIVANLEMICDAFETTQQDIGLTWLPVYHDMGLIGGVLQPIFKGFTTYIMSPLDFLQKPSRWLKLISEKRATISGGPHFAYELCLAKVTDEEARAIDLSSWRVAVNGAEPVKYTTVKGFTDRFAQLSRFSPGTMFPCYGLAEATLLVSGGPAGHGYRASAITKEGLQTDVVQLDGADTDKVVNVISCGRVARRLSLVIVNPQTSARCAPGAIGEVWIAGPSVGQGYWNKAEATAASFQARIAGESGLTYMRTGDLGFIDQHGALSITGRLKDLIIIRGKNHYPQDIELLVEQARPELRRGCCAAFASADGQGIGVMVEVRKEAMPHLDARQVKLDVSKAVSCATGLVVMQVVLVPPGKVSKTTSGKIKRRESRERVLKGEVTCLSEHGGQAAVTA